MDPLWDSKCQQNLNITVDNPNFPSTKDNHKSPRYIFHQNPSSECKVMALRKFILQSTMSTFVHFRVVDTWKSLSTHWHHIGPHPQGAHEPWSTSKSEISQKSYALTIFRISRLLDSSRIFKTFGSIQLQDYPFSHYIPCIYLPDNIDSGNFWSPFLMKFGFLDLRYPKLLHFTHPHETTT